MRQEFLNEMDRLQHLILIEKSKDGLTSLERESCDALLTISEKYTFENRIQMKGTLARTIVDSLEINHNLASQIIVFDNNIR